MASRFAPLSIAAVCSLLQTNGFDDEVVEIFRTNKIDGSTLLELNSDDLKELGIVALGDRKKLAKVKSAMAAPSPGPNGKTNTSCSTPTHKVFLFTVLYFRLSVVFFWQIKKGLVRLHIVLHLRTQPRAPMQGLIIPCSIIYSCIVLLAPFHTS